tara:strand:+ start:1169 stop:1510 length:342 start_codon:yes stop_codon:yes gene_type:complete
MLNQTSRKQVEPMIERFFDKWPTASDAAFADEEEMREVVKSLGMYNRRVKTIKNMSNQYLSGFENAKELYGCGKYADDAYRIFMKGDWQDVEPNDQALNKYHDWLKEENNVSV